MVSERQPEPRIPLITTIIGRIYKERGGQLLLNEKQRTADEKAATAQNKTAKVTPSADETDTSAMSDNLPAKPKAKAAPKPKTAKLPAKPNPVNTFPGRLTGPAIR